jgi:O-antigen ligase
MDAAIYAALMVAGVIVLFQRKKRAIALLKVSGPVLMYFLYCMISTAWSPFHGPAFKRWTKDVGDLVMVLVIVTDAQPMAALRRLYSRVGFTLLPFSIVLIRYTDLGRGYDPDGNPMNTGVTTNKNALGLIVFLISLGALWHVRALLLDRRASNRTRRLVAQATLLTFGIVLLQMAHCATAVGCFVLGGGLMLATGLGAIRNRPGRVHALCLGIVLIGGLTTLLGGVSILTGALGRNSDMGRADIWKASIETADSPIFGTGFESFWNANAKKVARNPALAKYWDMSNLVSAHNGYIEVYLDLGLVGLSLISLILISGYLRAVQAFKRDPQFGSLILAYVATGTFYSITEVGFRVLAPSWIFLLLAMVSARGVAAGLFGAASAHRLVGKTAAANKVSPDRKTADAPTSMYAI